MAQSSVLLVGEVTLLPAAASLAARNGIPAKLTTASRAGCHSMAYCSVVETVSVALLACLVAAGYVTDLVGPTPTDSSAVTSTTMCLVGDSISPSFYLSAVGGGTRADGGVSYLGNRFQLICSIFTTSTLIQPAQIFNTNGVSFNTVGSTGGAVSTWTDSSDSAYTGVTVYWPTGGSIMALAFRRGDGTTVYKGTFTLTDNIMALSCPPNMVIAGFNHVASPTTATTSYIWRLGLICNYGKSVCWLSTEVAGSPWPFTSGVTGCKHK